MSKVFRLLLTSLAFLLLTCGCTTYRNITAKLETNTDSSSYKLTTPVSKMMLIIPQQDLSPVESERRGGQKNPRYFFFKNDKTKLNISGWFEPHYLYPGQEKYFKQASKGFSEAGLGTPVNVKHFRHTIWRVTSYEMPCGNSYTPSIHAHFYNDDTWIDLHLSYDCDSGKKYEDLINFLDTIQVVPKNSLTENFATVRSTSTQDNSRKDSLIKAAAEGNLSNVMALIEARVDVNATENDGRTALIAASRNGYQDVVKELIAANADVNAKDKNGWSALITASFNGHLEVVKALIEAKADVNAKWMGGTALLGASIKGHAKIVKALIDANADVNAKVENGITALFLASCRGYEAIVKALIEAKADVNAKTQNGLTALIGASEQGHVEVVKMLIEAKADVTANADNDYTALAVASRNGHWEVVQLLKKKEDAFYYVSLGKEYMIRRDFYNAKKNFLKATGFDSTDFRIWGLAGTAAQKNREFLEAIQYLEKVVVLNPSDYRAYGNLGVINAGLKNYDDAISYFKKVLELNSTDLAATSYLAEIYFALNDYAHCEEYMNKFDQILSQKDTNLMSPKTKMSTEKALNKFSNYRTVIKKNTSN